MSRYVTFHGSRTYHRMRDGQHTTCGVLVIPRGRFDTYASGRPLPKVVTSKPAGLRFCSHCAEGGHKKGPRNPEGISIFHS